MTTRQTSGTLSGEALKQAGENEARARVRAWNDIAAERKHQIRMWQIFALALLFVNFILLAAYMYAMSQTQLIPYVIEVDKLGNAVGVGQASRAAVADERVIRASLASFIHDARMVTTDAQLQNRAVHRVFAMLSPRDPAEKMMQEYLGPKSPVHPFKRAEEEIVTVEILSVMRQAKNVWEIDWIETIRKRSGELNSRNRMRALLNVYVAERPITEETEKLVMNPLSIYVQEFRWDRINEGMKQ